MARIVLSLVCLALATSSEARTIETGFLHRTIAFEGEEYAYQVYVPRDYDAARSWPVILFLHGAGERGSEGSKPTHEGLGTALRLWPERWPAICVFPQARDGTNWQGASARLAMATLAATEAAYRTDPERVYLTGLSMGGNGVWYLGYHHPDRFAAMIAICGFVEFRPERYPVFTPEAAPDPYREVASRIAHVSVWIVHGDADTVVPVEQSRRMNAALEAAGADVTYVEVPGEGHGSWHPGYADVDLPKWLFGKTRRSD